ncbi:MAG: DNA internalization-related competence protein ComEC/Rec2 [Chloroflexi bacterium]|nr:DNA internalization-related competence protein ComEC/Rec2 [Chloroflexota bacterium]
MTIVVGTIAWMTGIWLASLMGWSLAVWLAAAVLALAAALFTRRWGQPALLLAALAALALGGARYSLAVPDINAGHIAYYNDLAADVGVVGVVVREPDVRDRYTNLQIAAERITLADGATYPVTGRVLVRANRFPEVPYGVQVAVNGRLQTPPEDENFSYKDYLARQGVYSSISQGRVRVLGEGAGQPALHAILSLKQKAQNAINRLIPDPEAALLSGILLGNDNGIPPDLAEDFRVTGMTHIIAISGFNIALLIAILISLVDPFLPRKTAVLVAVVGVILYTILVGAEASVVRAAIMGSLFLFTSRWLGRRNFAYASLFFAGFLMTLFRPLTLWDVGFQLSFTATLGLMLYADPFTTWTRRQLYHVADRPVSNQAMGILSEAVLLTVAAQILTLPLMIGYFRQLSLISLLANAFVLPIQPGVMLWGGAATLVGMVWAPLGQPLAWVAWLFLTATIRLVRAFAAVPFAAVPLHVPLTGILLMYAVIGAVTWFVKATPERRTAVSDFLRQNISQRLALGGSLVVLLLVGSWWASQPDGRLHVAFLDVGQGDAIFIQTPTGRQILVDGGNFPSVLTDRLGRHMPFWDRDIDILIATHPDADHVTGLTALFDRYQVGRVITNGQGLGESAIYDAVLQAAAAQGTPVHRALAGEVIEIGDGVRLEVLHPGAVLTGDRNENSVVLRLVYGDFSALLTGDADEASEAVMLANGRSLASLVLKAGHHGSQTSSSPPFLQAVQPQVLIISSGADNKFGHPHPEVLEWAQKLGTAVLRTDELGTIEVSTDGQQMWWQAGPKNGSAGR